MNDLHTHFADSKDKSVAIVTHVNPDGDGLCAAMALYLCLKGIYLARPYIVMDSAFPSFLAFLPYHDFHILTYQQYIQDISQSIDLLVAIDCHETDRVDTDDSIFSVSKKVLVIDHHVTKPDKLIDGYTYIIDENAVSTGVLVHRYMSPIVTKANPTWQKLYADCIYITILNDTDNLINANSDKEAFLTIAQLFDLGLVPHITVHEFLYKKPISYFCFIGDVLSTISMNKDHRIATYYADLQMLLSHNLTTDAYSKLMRWTKGATDVEILVLFTEFERDFYRISLRSDAHDVAALAQHFGGGGHKKASGFQLTGSREKVIETVVDYIESAI
jgi:phosphoesterase RecJ-like protein